MKRYMLWTLLGAMTIAPAMAQGDAGFDARLAAAKELYAAEQRYKILDIIIESQATIYVDRLAQSYPKLPKDRLATLRAKIESNLTETKNDYIAQEEALIAKQLSLQDLQSALAFYKSPIGQRLASAAAAIIPTAGKNQSIWVSNAVTRATNDMNASAKASK
ncbi:MAG TPA: DUF2059 domain-containing protein [Rhizomicrobium sp.]|jgi:hypothetical protein